MIRPATPDELLALGALARRSKAHWGYDAEFMAACHDELAVPDTLLHDGVVEVLEHEHAVVGFYSLEWLDETTAELDHLFVEPAAIGHGHGRRLLDQAWMQVRIHGRRRLLIQGDPNAEPFYLAMGARSAGERPSGSIPGRVLPLFVLE